MKSLHVGEVAAAKVHHQPARVASETSTVGGDALEERLFVLLYRQMHSLLGHHRAEFEDLVQIAAEQALLALPSFRRESELSTWTYRICYRVILRHRRWSGRWLRRFTLDAPMAEATDATPDARASLEQRERIERLRRALDGLSEKKRAVVVLRDLEELDIAEIASIVGTNESTVRSRLRDGRRRLAALLETDPYFGTDACSEEAS